MAEETAIDMNLDLQGLLCPIPVVKLAQAVKKVEIGQVIAAVATDPGVLGDIPSWCKTSGNELISLERDGKLFRFIVRRQK
jgi:tRNA 2-thiouridine synthesizing protein A